MELSNCYQWFLFMAQWSYAGFIKETKCKVPNIGPGRAPESAFWGSPRIRVPAGKVGPQGHPSQRGIVGSW